MMRLMALFLNERIFSLTLKFLPFLCKTCSFYACAVTYVAVVLAHARCYAHARIN